MSYSVKEIFYTLQGEGANVGRPAVFCRFSGCNLWSGREKDRGSATCNFCDTDFVGTNGIGGGQFESAGDLANAISSAWPTVDSSQKFVVCTGGEPLLQLDSPLIDALHAKGFEIAIETNGTLPAPPGLDWICVSPKAGTKLILTKGDELKIVFPQRNTDPAQFENLDFDYRFIQPMDSDAIEKNTRLAIKYCMRNPVWRLSVQTHKKIGIR